MSTTIRLKCLIEGETIVFPVTAACDDEVSDLKEFIQSKRALELWKPTDSNSVATKPANTLVERIGLLGHDLSEFANKLDPSDTVFSIFPTQPPRDCIHIIVKRPAPGGNGINITPSNSRVNIEDTNKEIEEELELLQPEIEAFLKNPERPIWVPQHTMPEIQKFIMEHRIPTYPNGKPSLLLHDLDKCDGKKIHLRLPE
ncbi:hypothetical protein AX14_011547 [Amanita brunnescens Koide BX004]|nr:hypothetical protein AX14_011547 [Amanita brunnescens Koide BX004]